MTCGERPARGDVTMFCMQRDIRTRGRRRRPGAHEYPHHVHRSIITPIAIWSSPLLLVCSPRASIAAQVSIWSKCVQQPGRQIAGKSVIRAIRCANRCVLHCYSTVRTWGSVRELLGCTLNVTSVNVTIERRDCTAPNAPVVGNVRA